MIYDDSTPKRRKPYKLYITEVETEARAVVCLVCMASYTVSAYVGQVHTKAEKCPCCGCMAGVEKFGMVIPPKNVLEGAEKYLVMPDDEVRQFAKEVNRAIYR